MTLRHTPGPWRWWTSCSYRRLSSDATGKQGDVAHATVHKDGCPDIVIRDDDMALIEKAPEMYGGLKSMLDEKAWAWCGNCDLSILECPCEWSRQLRAILAIVQKL